MEVLIVAEYLDNIADPGTYNSRFLAIADKLTERGHNVHIVTTDFIHSIKKHVSGVETYKECKLTALHEPGYPKNVCLKRFYSHYILSKNLKRWFKTANRPDVIYCAVPSLDFAYEAAVYAKKNNVKFVLDIQDLWPEAFEMVLNIPVVSKIIFSPLRLRADSIYRCADKIIAVSDTYVKRAKRVNKKASGAEAVFLGTELSRFDAYRDLPPAIEKREGEIFLGYVGTLGHSYDIVTVMDAIDLLKEKPYYDRIRFVIAGDGPLRRKFEDYAESKKLNVSFLGKLPYPEMVATLCVCDIAINPIVKRAAGSIINKHGDYAASGISVVNSQECPEYRELVDTWQMGLNCECENSHDMAEKIAYLIENEDARIRKGCAARECAEERFDRAHSYLKIIETIEN